MPFTQSIIDYLRKQLPCTEVIYLFGSQVNGPPRKDSDVDVAVLSKTPLPPLQRWQLASELARQLNREVDLIDLHQASTVMQFQVVSTGRRIFARHESVAEQYELRVYQLYLTLNDDRAGILEAITASGTVYGQ